MVSFFRVIGSRRMLVAGVMGFSSGLPLLLTVSLLQAWMKKEGVDLGTIGLMSLVGLPYTVKFLWAPFLDRYIPPFLGRRRGWLLIFQICLAASIAWLGQTDPAHDLWMVSLVALFVTFFSASQDIVIDAYRREDLADEELGLGSSMYVNGYRVGMLLASGGGLILADYLSFQMVYLIMAGAISVGVITTLLTPEPVVPQGLPVTLKESVIEPFAEYFSRPHAIWILTFVLMYKIGDQMASAITTPFYMDLKFSLSEIGTVVKLFGFWATLTGGFVGGIMILRLGIYRSLLIFGILQGVSTAGFSALALIGSNVPALAAVISFENISGGMGTSAYVAFLASITNKRFTATQYALLTGFMGIPRVIASSITGYMAEAFGWFYFFLFCALIAAPALFMIRTFAPDAPTRPPRI